MYVFLNGAFGVGQTTVARELRTLLSGAIYDPELIGLLLQRLPGRSRSDFQHFPSWRRLTIAGAKAAGAIHRIVIIPMAFSERAYLEEVRSGLLGGTRPVVHFCLTAPYAVVRERLAGRGEPEVDGRVSWVHRRAKECCAAHEDPAFRVHIPTAGRPARAVADEIAARIRTAGARSPKPEA